MKSNDNYIVQNNQNFKNNIHSIVQNLVWDIGTYQFTCQDVQVEPMCVLKTVYTPDSNTCVSLKYIFCDRIYHQHH